MNTSTATATTLCSGQVYPSRYIVGSESVSSAEYESYERNLFSNISGILLRNGAYGVCSEEAYDAMERYTSQAMTLDDAIKYLE